MKCVFFLFLLGVSCVVGVLGTAKQDEHGNGPLLDSLIRSRRQSGGVNYGFPTFPDFGRQGQLPGNFGGGSVGGGLFSRSDFSDFMPDTSNFKGNQGWATKSCVYDEKGKAKCVEQVGDKPKS